MQKLTTMLNIFEGNVGGTILIPRARHCMVKIRMKFG